MRRKNPKRRRCGRAGAAILSLAKQALAKGRSRSSAGSLNGQNIVHGQTRAGMNILGEVRTGSDVVFEQQSRVFRLKSQRSEPGTRGK